MQDRIKPQFTDNAMKVLCKRYLRPAAPPHEACKYCGMAHETPEEMFGRVTFGDNDYYNLLASLDFLPNSPTLFNAGTGQGTHSGCFKFDVDDSLKGIMDVATKAAFVQKWGGGVGYCLSVLRPKGAPIKTTHGRACGPVAVQELYQAVAKLITQGGRREGAQMAILHVDHPDVREFIHCKDVPAGCQCALCPLRDECKSNRQKVLSTFNISVACTDSFMKEAAVSGTKQSALLKEMADSAWRTGDPGCFFIDTAERANPTPWLGKLTGTNPCGEVPLLDNEPCNLGSINLSHMVVEVGGRLVFDYSKLKQVVRLAVRYLDGILDRNIFPVEAITQAASVTRKLGLGVMGWADTLAALHIHYDCDEAVEFAGRVMASIQQAAHDESRVLAQEKGVCPAFTGSDSSKAQLREGCPTRRNATVTCIAPAGTISILAGCSSGIEPHYTLAGERVMGDGVTRLTERMWVDSKGFTPRTAHEIHWSWHIKHQAAFQQCTDLAVSKTINMPETATPDDVLSAFVMAWQLGCKGITVYRNKSRARQVITSDAAGSIIASTTKRRLDNGRQRMPVDAISLRHKFSVGGMEGYLHTGLFPDGSPGELFITGSKQGSTIGGLMDGIAILTSMALQYGVPLEAIVNKMKGTRFEPFGQTENKEIPMASSVLDYIYRYLGKRFVPGEVARPVSSGMLCPGCGAEAIIEEGCLKCGASCGWSRC